jgi:hypothetical protein
MPTADADIDRTANRFFDLHGSHAVGKARGMASDLQRQGDIVGADRWLRVIVAIEERMRNGAAE